MGFTLNKLCYKWFDYLSLTYLFFLGSFGKTKDSYIFLLTTVHPFALPHGYSLSPFMKLWTLQCHNNPKTGQLWQNGKK